MKTLILDNYDSFTYNLYQYIGELGGEPVVCRNDRISVAEVRRTGSRISSSSGAGQPYVARDIGISHELIDYAEQSGFRFWASAWGNR